MNTFLPLPDYKASAEVLDDKRLGKQRVECLQLVNTLLGKSTGWKNHPCTRMWQGRVNALIEYGLEICYEWVRRGFKDTVSEQLYALFDQNDNRQPYWLGSYKLHYSHQCNLLRKDLKHYGQYWPNLEISMPYFWPSNIYDWRYSESDFGTIWEEGSFTIYPKLGFNGNSNVGQS